MDRLFIDMSNPNERNTLWQALRNLRGLYRIEITRDRKLRSSAANRFYWGVVIAAFRQYLAEQGDPVTANFCHELLKNKFLLQDQFGIELPSSHEFTSTDREASHANHG